MQLTATKRTVFGKSVKSLRREGMVPAELYGHGTENMHLTVSAKEFARVFRVAGESTLVDLVVDGTRHPVMVHDVMLDPVSDEALSIDFYKVRLDEKITVKVPLAFAGEAPAVKNLGGVLVRAMHEVEVEALPQAIPHSIEISVNTLDAIGKSIYVRDIVATGSFSILANPETVIATVTEKAPEEEVVATPEAAAIEAVKVETEEKKAERDKKKEAAAEGEKGGA